MSAGDIIVLLLLAVIVLLIIRSIVRDKRQHRSGCGGHCGSCPMGRNGSCHHT